MISVFHFKGQIRTLDLTIRLKPFVILNSNRTRKILGISYVVIKVCLLSVVEIGIFPLVCGWWLDICSLPLFDATLKVNITIVKLLKL
jgi:E3 ubiquitin-protein ligase MARCH6